jgi:hypothetical protein
VTSAVKNLLRLRPYENIRPPVVRNEMKPETRRLISITPIEQKPEPHLQSFDKRKHCIYCSNIATKDVLFEPGATIIERYCDSCLVSLK